MQKCTALMGFGRITFVSRRAHSPGNRMSAATINRSRVTLAMIEAGGDGQALWRRPLIMVWQGILKSGARLPSTNTATGRTGKSTTARPIAAMVAASTLTAVNFLWLGYTDTNLRGFKNLHI